MRSSILGATGFRGPTWPQANVWQKIRGGAYIVGGVALATIATWGIVISGGTSIPLSMPAIYGAAGLAFQGIEDIWHVDMPDLPLIP